MSAKSDRRSRGDARRSAVLLVVLAGLGLLPAGCRLRIGPVTLGREDVDRRRMGYCFDVATTPHADRLLATAGVRGLHVLDLREGKLDHVTTYHDDGCYRNLKPRDGRAYVADSWRGLVVVDVSGDRPVTTWIESGGTAGGIHL